MSLPSECRAERNIGAPPEQNVGHGVGLRIGKSLDIGRLTSEEIRDTDLETRLLVDLKSNLEIVIEDIRRAVADVSGRRIEVGRLADPLRRPGRADAVLLDRKSAV